MKERPILFSSPMIRAILAGRKTQTRRVINMDRLSAVVPRPIVEEINGHHLGSTTAGRFRVGLNPQGAVFKLGKDGQKFGLKPGEFNFACPYVDGRTWITPKTPDRSAPWTITPAGSQTLWVRETWRSSLSDERTIHYAASLSDYDREEKSPWRPSIFMPRWASRITLEVTEVRVQRLQEVDELDALAEGVEGRSVESVLDGKPGEYIVGTARDEYATLWDSINGKRSPWSSNSWIWAVTFRRLP